MLQVGQLVKFANPQSANEMIERFTVVELRGTRVLVEFVCDLAIKPTFVYLVSEMVEA